MSKSSDQRYLLTKEADFPFLGRILRKYVETYGQAEIRWRQPESQRTVEQNDRMWAMLGDVSEQVNWYGQKLQPDEWKDVFSASLKRQAVVPGIDGGFVVLGMRTSKMSIRLMSELIELMFAFGAQDEHQVYWTDPKVIAQMQAQQREAA